jgi:hypothetical protein
MPPKKILNILLQEFRDTHGEEYDYSLITNYINMNTPVQIICRIHGSFFQNPNNHKNGSRCPGCSINSRVSIRRKTKENFVKEAENIFGINVYDYSLFNYVNNNTPSEIKCIKCNISFPKRPGAHLKGEGCLHCKKKEIKKLYMENGLNKFLRKAKEIHGDRYDYSKLNYINSVTKVIIICQHHGEFKQRPGDHINKKCGCAKCGKIQMGIKQSIGPDEFIRRANEKHGEGKFDYSLVKDTWVNTHRNVKIICHKHGKFEQSPSNHLSTNGCNKCGIEKTAEKTRNNIEYKIEKWKKNSDFEYLDFSKCIYINCDKKLDIFCLKDNHGLFKQSARLLDKGFGCKKCHPNKDEEFIYNYLIELQKELIGTEWEISKIFYKDIENKPFMNINPIEIDIIIKFKNGFIKSIEFDGPTHSNYEMYKNNNGYLIKYLKHWKRDILKNYYILSNEKAKYFEKNIDSLLRIDYESWKKYDEKDKISLIKNFICSKNNAIIYSDSNFYEKISKRNLMIILAYQKFMKHKFLRL